MKEASLKSRVARIKKHITMPMLVRYYGGSVWTEKKAAQTRCIIEDHIDSNPSARVFPDSNILLCFSCGFRGDVVDVVKRNRNADLLGGVEFLEKEFNIAHKPVEEVKKGWDSTIMQRKVEEDVVRSIQRSLLSIYYKVPKHRRYIYREWADWIWFLMDDYINHPYVGGVMCWGRMSKNIIDKYLKPLTRENELLTHGGISAP